MVLHHWAWYKTKISTSKYKIRCNFMGSSLIFRFLYIKVLNYCYFHTNCSTFLKMKNVEKIKKTFLNVYYNVYYNYVYYVYYNYGRNCSEPTANVGGNERKTYICQVLVVLLQQLNTQSSHMNQFFNLPLVLVTVLTNICQQ